MGRTRGFARGFKWFAVLAILGTLLVACNDNHRSATNCTSWRYTSADQPAPGVLPTEYDPTNYKLTSSRDTTAALNDSPQNQCGQEGMAVDLAWGVTQGSSQVTIAELDSGINWSDVSAMQDLADKIKINLGEAQPPCWPAIPSGDCNGDGVFNILDFGAIPDLNHNGIADPEDLILNPKYNDGVDNDHDGYVDDIAGWDFLYGDNDPYDTVHYGHGTGEELDSGAAANGTGDVGTCPKCMELPVRVGDSFVADGGRFAAGVLFGLDNHVNIIQEALGAISNPPQAQQAVDAAYAEGVPVVASMADEESEHPNIPSSLNHTIAVNSITQRKHALGTSDGWLATNGCTNFGGHVIVSVESSSCSSEATGLSAGIVGLIESEAIAAGVPRNPNLPANATNVLSVDELREVLQSNADDVDFSTPNSVDPANNYSSTGDLTTSSRYPTRPGWDEYTGYGRLNAYESVRLVSTKRIPPEAAITAPSWFSLLPTTGTVNVTGTVGGRLASSYDYQIEWAPGVQPPAYPATDTWTVIGSGTGLTSPQTVSAPLDLAWVAAALPGDGSGTPTTSTGTPDPDRFSVRIRIVTTAHGSSSDGLVGIDQKQIFVHNDPDLRPGFPKTVPGASTSSPVFANLTGTGNVLLVATSDGTVHAYKPDGTEPFGWPVHTTVAPWWPVDSPTAAQFGIAPMHSAIMVGAPAVADLLGNGQQDVVVTDFDGNVWAWNPKGQLLPGFGITTVEGHVRSSVHVDLDYSRDSTADQDEFNRTYPGFVGAAAIGKLDSHPGLDIVAAGMDRHVYAWHDDGTPVPGFPVLVVDPSKVASVDPVSNKVTFTANSGVGEGGELVATPALADLNGDGFDEVIVGAQESYSEPINADSETVASVINQVGIAGNSRLYAISSKGNLNTGTTGPDPSSQAYLPGWPVALAQLDLGVLPDVGDGVATQVAVGDITGSGKPEIIATSAGGPIYVLNAAGKSVYGNDIIDNEPITLAWAGGLLGEADSEFGSNRQSNDIDVSITGFSGPSLGTLDGDSLPDVSAPTVGFGRLTDLDIPDHQDGDNQLGAWTGTNAHELSGFPRITSDLALFVTPAIGDVDGSGQNVSIAGNGVYTIDAVKADGSEPAGWPKLTGGWLLGTPGLGDWDGNGKVEVAVVRRDGQLLVWNTNGSAANLTQWPRFGGNSRNTGTRTIDAATLSP